MAEWERHEEQHILHRVTYKIPSGVGSAVVDSVLQRTAAEWRELSGLDRDAEVPPEAVTWHATEEGLLVRVEAVCAELDEGLWFRTWEQREQAEEPGPEPAGDQPVEAPDTEEVGGDG